VNPGVDVMFRIVATGTSPLNYQWLLGGLPIIGQTNTSFLITNVQQGHAGNYSVQVSNGAGSALSADAALAVSSFPSLVAAVFSNKTFQCKLLGRENTAYVIDFSTNLSTWTTFQTSTANSVFLDSTAPGSVARYYRARQY